MAKLKPCPFCGSGIRLDEVRETIDMVSNNYRCNGCNMEFSYRQYFKYSSVARVMVNPPFEDVWNRRYNND